MGFEVVTSVFSFRLWEGEKALVDADFGVDGVLGGDPVDGGFHLSAFGVFSESVGIVGAVDLSDVALLVFDDAGANDAIRVAEADFGAWGETEEFLRRVFHKIVPLDIKLAAERDRAGACVGILRIVDRLHHLLLIFRIIVDDDFDGIEHGHDAWSDFIEMLAHAEVEKGDIGHAVDFGHADRFAEIPDGFRGEAASAETRDGGHAGIVPAIDEALFYQCQELALAHDGVGQVEAGELDLARLGGDGDVVDEPLIQRAMVLEFEGANRVRDVLDGVRLAMGEVIHRVDLPFVTRAVVIDMEDTVKDGIAQIQVGSGHVDFGAEDFFTIGELAVAHPGEEIEVLLHAAVAEGAFFSRLGERAAGGADLLGILVIHVGFSLADEMLCPFVNLIEVAGCKEKIIAPVKAEPADIVLDGVDVFRLFLAGVGVVESQVAAARAGGIAFL